MNENRREFNWSRAGSSLNRLGIDESNLRHLKALFVTQMLEEMPEWQRDIESVCSISPDTALLMLRRKHEWHAHVLEHVAKAEKSLGRLAFKLDADGRFEEQYQHDFPSDGRYEAALDVLRRSANDSFEPPTEEEKSEALEVLQSMYGESHLPKAKHPSAGEDLQF